VHVPSHIIPRGIKPAHLI